MVPLILLLALAQGNDQPGRWYRDGEVARARAAYERLLPDAAGRARGVLCYNLGTCAARDGRWPEAVWWLRRAQLRLPDDPAVRHNLAWVLARLGLPVEEAPTWERWLQPLHPVADRDLLVATLVCLTAGLVGWILAASGPRVLLWAALTLAGLAGEAELLRRCRPAPAAQAVVLAPDLPVRDVPHAGSDPRGTLPAGLTVSLQESSDRWALIRHQDREGWVEADGIGAVD